MSPRVPVPGLVIGEDGKAEMQCWDCGESRRRKYAGIVNWEKSRRQRCLRCYLRSLVRQHEQGPVNTEPDEMVVDLMVAGGYRLRAMKSERLLALQVMLRKHPGWPGWKYADHLNVSVRTVERYRAELRREQVAA